MNLSEKECVSFFNCILFLLIQSICNAQQKINVETFTVRSDISIRTLATVNKNVCWFAGNKGVWGVSKDGGATWKIDSIKTGSKYIEFRAIAALNDSTCLLLSIDSPAYIFKTTSYGAEWKQVYKNSLPKIFFDAIYFENDSTGYAIADPIDGDVQLIKTTDRGDNWGDFAVGKTPYALDGEAFFAASNSILKTKGKNICFVSGGNKSRLFTSRDGGKSFSTESIPMESGNDLAGTFSFDTYNEKLMVFAGGDYKKSDSTVSAFVISKDGGKTFKSIKTPVPFFGSCVKFISSNKLIVTGHHGTFVYNINKNKWVELQNKRDEELKFNTISIPPSGKKARGITVWLAGNKGKIAKILLKK